MHSSQYKSLRAEFQKNIKFFQAKLDALDVLAAKPKFKSRLPADKKKVAAK